MREISIIVPCFNEEETVEVFYETCKNEFSNIEEYNFKYIFVDDGSTDNTLKVIRTLAKDKLDVLYLSFSRNFGKEAAILAGLKNSNSDYSVIMDVDLQHPPSLLKEMIYYINEGYDSVAATRLDREGEKWYRKLSSKLFYKIINKFSDINIQKGATDYRIMTRTMVESVLELKENQRFSKGIFEWVGYNTKWVEYKSEDRVLGESKWSPLALIKYAVNGIISFSTVPLKIASLLGAVISFGSLAYLFVIIGDTIIRGIDMPGYASTISFVLFLGGIQLIALGVLGEYISKIYMEVKNRPDYFIRESKCLDYNEEEIETTTN